MEEADPPSHSCGKKGDARSAGDWQDHPQALNTTSIPPTHLLNSPQAWSNPIPFEGKGFGPYTSSTHKSRDESESTVHCIKLEGVYQPTAVHGGA